MNKTIFVALSSLLVFQATASTKCSKEARSSAQNLEAKHSKVQSKEVKVTEQRELGSGGLLSLQTLFVDSPKTGDNTHWEIVTEIKSCKTLLARRYWAH